MIVKTHTARFNGVDIDSIPGVSILNTDPYKMPRRDVLMEQISRTNKSRTNSAFFVERIIVVRIAVQRNTRALMEQSIDAVMAILQGVNKELIVDQSGGNRLYYATLADAPVEEDGGSYQEIDLTFTCTDRYGYSTSASTILTIGTTTAASRSDNITFTGSAITQTPIFTITYSALTGGTNKTVNIGNGSTGQVLSITRNWTSGDILRIDTSGLVPSVKVNSTEVDFMGAFPTFAVGAGTWSYSDNLTTRTFTGSITCVSRYV